MKTDVERKMDVIESIAEAYPQRNGMFTERAIKLFIAALDGTRAEYVERALPLAISENTFPPTIAHLVAIIKREQWHENDEQDFRGEHVEEYMAYPVPKALLNEWLDAREKERITTERGAQHNGF